MKKVEDNVYLDYSATTKVHGLVLKRFNHLSENFYANPNSKHLAGRSADDIVSAAKNNICSYFNIYNDELIFTSGATESNNTILKGIRSENRNHIITTKLEHSSIFGPLGYLQKNGYRVSFVSLNVDGSVNLDSLESLITKDTLLVSITAVDSELGIRQPIEEIGKLLKKHPEIYFHSDITQCLGKDQLDITNVDLASFSGHKIYCMKGIGGLIKKRHVKLEQLLHGGKGSSIYRSGTPCTELIGALSCSFDLLKTEINESSEYLINLSNKIKNHIQKYPSIKINSTCKSVPHILNISIININSDLIQKFFEKYNIYISTKSACSSDTELSKSVHLLTGDKKRAISSVRVSLSYYTTILEVDYFLEVLDKLMEENYEIN